MIGRAKITGALIVAMLLLAFASPAAQADPVFEFSNSSGDLTGIGGSSEKITTEAGTIVCNKIEIAAPYSASSQSTLSFVTVHSECKAFGFLSATVDSEICAYVFDPYEKVGEGNYRAKFSVDCGAGESIKVVASTCSMEIQDVAGNQGLSYVALSNSENKILMDPNVSPIVYQVTNDGFLCPFNGTGKKTDGTYTSTAAVKLTAAGGATAKVAGS